MRPSPITVVGTLVVGVTLSSLVAAHTQNPEELMKWGLAEVVHYDIVGEYAAPTMIVAPGGGLPGMWSGSDRVAVTDRFEISLDAGRAHIGVVGKPVIRNFPSTMAAKVFEGACRQPPPLSGRYEHIEVIDYKYGINELDLTTKRTYPGASVPLTNEVGHCGLHPVPGRTDTVTHRLPVIEPTFLAMPGALRSASRIGDVDTPSAPNKVTVQPDGKTLIVDDSSRGWKYTYTLRIVK